MFSHKCAETIEEGGTLGARGVEAPDSIDGLLCCGNCGVDILVRSLSDLGDQFSVRCGRCCDSEKGHLCEPVTKPTGVDDTDKID